jgi:hypothetical protein
MTADFGDGHTFDAGFAQGILDGFKSRGLNNGLKFHHENVRSRVTPYRSAVLQFRGAARAPRATLEPFQST